MTYDNELEPDRLTAEPLVLTVPGLNNSGEGHWQTIWERERDDCYRVEMGGWDKPHRNTWVNKLNLAIHQAGRPVVLVAHSLGCLAVAWWAEYERPSFGNPVVGALLVAPPDVDLPTADPRIAPFGICPRNPLPFPAFLAASENDPWCSLKTARQLARDWQARFAFSGAIGHINASSGIGEWAFGKVLLDQLLTAHSANLTGREAPRGAARYASAGMTSPSV